MGIVKRPIAFLVAHALYWPGHWLCEFSDWAFPDADNPRQWRCWLAFHWVVNRLFYWSSEIEEWVDTAYVWERDMSGDG